MIAKSRQMAAHDFFLVLLSAAVLALLLWPPGPAVREVEVRRNDGSLQTYQLTADDPKLANLTQKLQRWSNPASNSRTAINKWNAELGSLYAERTTPEVTEELKRILPVSYYPDHARKREVAAQQAARLKQQQAYWLDFQRQAEHAVQAEQQRQENLLALHASPPVSIGDPQPGPYPPQAIVSSSLIGLCAAMLFGAWNFLAPSIQLVKQPSVSQQARQASEKAPDSNQADTRQPNAAQACQQFQVTLPAQWLKVRQPLGVWIRQTAYLTLITSVVLVSSTSMLNPNSQWRGLPARMLWGEHSSGSASPLQSHSNKPMLWMQKSGFAPRTS
ncbi:MAG: hypothetical protein ACR2OA_09790 [Rubripirellula sp.]